MFPNSDKCQFPTHRYLSVRICVQAGAEAWGAGDTGTEKVPQESGLFWVKQWFRQRVLDNGLRDFKMKYYLVGLISLAVYKYNRTDGNSALRCE